MRVGWHEGRFTEDPRKVSVNCAECSRPMWLPASKVGVYKRCSPECAQAAKTARRDARRRPCETCGKVFLPRPWLLRQGYGRYCSQACNTPAAMAITSPEVKLRAKQRMRDKVAAGLVLFRRGEDHPSWKGGTAAGRKRAVESGSSAERIRRYRAKNPHKVREFSDRRKNRVRGRLPVGSVEAIGNLQRWKCAICAVSIKRGYHMDHIVPVARGGAHKPSNIQLLCQSCNLRKGAKDPVAYMQSLGRLL
jgi:hypothetical protein